MKALRVRRYDLDSEGIMVMWMAWPRKDVYVLNVKRW